MKLTEKDRQCLINLGYKPTDFRQIEEASKVGNMEIFAQNRNTGKKVKVTQGKAHSLLGRVEFFSGIGRASFHRVASRESLDGKVTVYFDATKFFKKYQ